jgi:hypothetical protein
VETRLDSYPPPLLSCSHVKTLFDIRSFFFLLYFPSNAECQLILS